MDKFLFIVNPVAGGGKAKTLIPLIKETMNKYKENYEIKLTSKPKEAIYIAEQGVDNYEIIVAVGGDGTVNEVARGLINKGKGTLGIIPGGTGNDMARSLSVDMDPKESLEVLCRGVKRDIDIGKINGYKFLNIASVGFDAEVVVNNVNLKKKIRSGMSYAISVIYTLISFKKKKVQIDIDGEIIDDKIILLALGNGKYYGGGMKILPMAKVDDGYFHICMVSGVGKIKLLFLFPTIFKGNHIKYKKYVKTYKAKTIKIKTEDKVFLNIDGEIVPDIKEIVFSMENKKLNVIYEESSH